ncbi:hypothetical protein DSO57_1029314 [Entomophthora muscae]|uniref:Uncharacterized protein n=1 Tax=Entomophthora muscae TaxID=34485 RepID=A0ACC2TN08_9FUNG|nr:hypothetical protein DSO57_1029314 [Entomophthora muscae]
MLYLWIVAGFGGASCRSVNPLKDPLLKDGLQGQYVEVPTPNNAIRFKDPIHYVSLLEFDNDMTFYRQDSVACLSKNCTTTSKGRYSLTRLSQGPFQEPAEYTFNLTTLNSETDIFNARVERGGERLVINPGKDQRVFYAKPSSCVDNGECQGPSLCATDKQCRMKGRLLTPCSVTSDCDSSLGYMCQNNACLSM